MRVGAVTPALPRRTRPAPPALPSPASKKSLQAFIAQNQGQGEALPEYLSNKDFFMSRSQIRNPAAPQALVLQAEFAAGATSADRRRFAAQLRFWMARCGHLMAASGCVSVVVPVHPNDSRRVCHQLIDLLPLFSGLVRVHFTFPVPLRDLLRGECNGLEDFAKCLMGPGADAGVFIQRITEGALLQGVARLEGCRLADQKTVTAA